MIALLLAVATLLAMSGIGQAKLGKTCVGDTCIVSGDCTDFIAKYDNSSNWVVKNGACFRKPGQEGLGLSVSLQYPVYSMKVEIVSVGTPSSILQIQGSDFFNPSLSLANYSKSPSVVYVPFDPRHPGKKPEVAVLKRSRVQIVVNPLVKRKSTPTSTIVPIFMPLGPHNLTIALGKLNSANPYNLGIKSVSAVLGQYTPLNNTESLSTGTGGRRASSVLACAKNSYDRGVGAIPTECAAGQEKQAGLCYTACKAGYYGVGPVCWEACRSGETDTGVACYTPISTTDKSGRPCGCWSLFGVSMGCPDPACCFGGSCPAGYTNNGCFCGKGGTSRTKGSYGRGVGTPMSCSSTLESNAGLCYKKCAATETPFVTMCLQKCPADLPTDCGALCGLDASACASIIVKMAAYSGANASFIVACLAAGVGTAGLATLGCAAAFVGLATSGAAVGLGLEVC